MCILTRDILIQLYTLEYRGSQKFITVIFQDTKEEFFILFSESILSAIMYSDRELRKLNQVQLDSIVRVLFFA